MGNKNIHTDSILKVRETSEKLAAQIVIDTLEAMGYDPEDLSVKLHIKDNSKVKWKSKSHFVKLFIVELKTLLKQNKLNVEKTGFVTILASYIDFQDNSLRNDSGDYLSQKDIIEITGFGRKKVSQLLKELIEDEILISTYQKEDSRKKRYYINPNLFYRGTDIHKTVKEYFENK